MPDTDLSDKAFWKYYSERRKSGDPAGIPMIEFIREWRRRAEVVFKAYNAWIDDLQSGMYVNCVYCGHRYGPGETTPVSMADALKAHIETCPDHPMSKLKARIIELESQLGKSEAGSSGH